MLLEPPQGRSREQILRDASEARRIMQSPLLQEFFGGAPVYLARAFVESTSPADREELFAEARGIERLRIFLESLVNNGVHIEAEDEREARTKAAATSAH